MIALARSGADYLPRTTLFRLLAVLTIVVAPHATHLPVWESGLIALLIGWRVMAALKGWRMPSRYVKAVLTIGAFMAVGMSYGRVSGQHAGVALLVAMLVLKLTELSARRDVMVLVFMMYFLLITHFLYSQAFWTIIWLLGATVAITSILIDTQHAGAPLPWRQSTRLAGTMTAQALPLMILMFLLFPRLPGPLWGMPTDASARTGLSDTMTPGDIAQLIQSEEPAFRVRFFGSEPAPADLYWRGPVLSSFDGRSWGMRFVGDRSRVAPKMRLRGKSYAYEMVLEPNYANWMLGLDLTAESSIPPESFVSADSQLLSRKVIGDRRLYRAVGFTDYALEPDELPDWQREGNLQLPRSGNPEARALAERWRDELRDPAAIVNAALSAIRNEPFHYTLRPPPLGKEPIDDFWFKSRKGFCEHYASAFAFLMRAAGIPARVVTGYQGGERNGLADYFLIRQSDAHAWTEVWYADRGWVRVDPTAAIAPERIDEDSMGTAPMFDLEAAGSGLGWTRVRYMLEARRDQFNAYWDRWVLGYGQEQQRELMERLGLAGNWRNLLLALTAAVSIVGAAIGVMLMRNAQPRLPKDPALREWHRATRRLARLGLEQGAAEGPRDYAERVAASHPALGALVRDIAVVYLCIRYADDQSASSYRRLRTAVDTLLRTTLLQRTA